jgi:hypothetical protein
MFDVIASIRFLLISIAAFKVEIRFRLSAALGRRLR